MRRFPAVVHALVLLGACSVAACGGGGGGASVAPMPGPAVALTVAGGDRQGVLAHRQPAAPLRVKAIDARGNGVEDVDVTFKKGVAGGYFTPETVATDADGIAEWRGYVHVAGDQQVLAQAANLPAVAFSLFVASSGSEYDGAYAIVWGDTGRPMFAENSYFTVVDGVLGQGTIDGPYALAISPAEGKVTFHFHRDLLTHYYFDGTLTVDAEGRAVATGTRTIANVTPAGTFRLERQ